jgi:hypothetical protein
MAKPKLKYAAAYDPSMAMSPGVEQALAKINLDMSGVNALEQEATRGGPSAWGLSAMRKAGIQEQDARERAKQEAISSGEAAKTSLAMRGGLSSGAGERLANQVAQQTIEGSQDAGRQGDLNRISLQMGDEQNRLSALSQLPGAQQNVAQFGLTKTAASTAAKEADQANLLNEALRKQGFKQGKYQEQMQSWAAGKQAKAIQDSEKEK